jgi:hypothetical protein
MSNRIRTLVVSLVILALASPAVAQGLNAGRSLDGESVLGWLWHSLVNPLVAVFGTSSATTTTTADPDSPKDTLTVLVAGDPDGPTGDLAVHLEAGDPDGPTGD